MLSDPSRIAKCPETKPRKKVEDTNDPVTGFIEHEF